MASEWREVRLGDVADLITGYPFKSQHYTDIADAPRLIGGDNIAQGNLRWENVRRWPRNMTNGLDEYWLEPGDVVLAMDRPWIEAGLKRAVVGMQDVPSLLIQRTARLRGTAELDTAFLRYVVGSQAFAQYILSVQTGTAVPHISPAQIRAFRFVLPPLKEQRAIAATLCALDDRIDNLRQTNAMLAAIAAALFKSWFVQFDDVPQSDMQESGLGLIPKGWSVASLSELLDIVGGGTPKTTVAEYWSGDIPWFSVVDTPEPSDVFVIATEKNITQAGLQGSSVRLIPKGTTIISARGTIGNLAVAGCDMTFNQSCYALRGKNGAGDYFVFFTAQRMVDQLRSMAHGSVFSTITRQTFDAIRVVVPPEELLTRFEQTVSPWFQKVLSNVQHSQNLAQLRDVVLPRLISGQLRVKQ